MSRKGKEVYKNLITQAGINLVTESISDDIVWAANDINDLFMKHPYSQFVDDLPNDFDKIVNDISIAVIKELKRRT